MVELLLKETLLQTHHRRLPFRDIDELSLSSLCTMPQGDEDRAEPPDRRIGIAVGRFHESVHVTLILPHEQAQTG